MKPRAVAIAALVVAFAGCSHGGARQATGITSTTPPSSATSSPTSIAVPLTTTSTTAVVPKFPLNPTSTAVPVACPALPARVGPDPDRPRYVLSVDVRLDQNVVDGSVTVRFTPDLATDRLVFRLWPNGPREAAAGAHLDTGPVTVGAHPAAAELVDPTTLVVHPGAPLAAGRAVDITVPWRLTLPGEVNDRVSRSGESVRLGSFFPILSWEPGVGWATEPPTSGYAEAATSTTADFAYTVTVPPGLSVLGSGVSDGNGRWKADAVRDVALSVGRFTIATGVAHAPDPVQVTVGAADGTGEAPREYLDKEIAVIEDFANRFGPYPWPSFTMAITPGLSGGIEYPTHVMQGPGKIGRTTSHEMAHQWFYSLVGNDQERDPWLDEGLASWAEARYENSLTGFVKNPLPPDARGRLGEPMTYWETRQSSYYQGVYVQGVQALAALGDPALVDCALRHYVARDAYRIARPSDLAHALSVVFPNAPDVLRRFGARL